MFAIIQVSPIMLKQSKLNREQQCKALKLNCRPSSVTQCHSWQIQQLLLLKDAQFQLKDAAAVSIMSVQFQRFQM